MKKILFSLSLLIATDNFIQARGGGGFHGGGGGHMGGGHASGASHMSGSRSGGSRSGSSRSASSRSASSRSRGSNRNGSGNRSQSSNRNRNSSNHDHNHNGNNYNHTNNFYGGRGGYGYGGWGAWGMFGFTALATTGVLLAASSNGNNNNAQLQQAFTNTQIEMEQLQKRLDALEEKKDDSAPASSTEESPFNDPQAIKAYMEQLKKAQIDLKKAQAQQSPTPDEKATLDTESSPEKATEEKIETLQDRLTGLKAQLYDYWHGTENNDQTAA